MKKSPLLTLFLVVFLDLVGFGIVIPILPYYSKEFGADAFALGWLMASYSIAQFFFSPFWGALSDRVGRRPVLLVTILAGSCCVALSALASSYWLLFASRLFAGIFAANISTASAYIADVTTPENRAKGMGVIGAGFGLGFIFGPAIGGVLSPYGLAVPLLFAAFLGLANFFVAFFVLEESKKGTSGATQKKFSRENLKVAFRYRSTKGPIVIFFLNVFAFTQLEVIFALYVLLRYGYDARDAGWLLAMVGVIGAVVQGGLIGRLSKRFGEKNLLLGGFFLLVISMFLAAQPTEAPLFVVALMVIGLGNALVTPVLSSLASKGAPAEDRGSVMGIYQSAGSIARVAGPPISGYLFDRVGPASPILFACAMMALAFFVSFKFREHFA